MTRSSYTVDFKLSVVEWVNNGGKSLREASKQFGIDRKCIRQWVREKAVLGSARLRQGPRTRKLHGGRAPLSQDLDKLVLGFLLERRRRGRHVRDHEIKQEALHASRLLGLEDFKASPSWLKGWKLRNGISEQTLSGDSSDLLMQQPVGSSLISHVTPTDRVLLTQQSVNCHDDLTNHHDDSNGRQRDDHIMEPSASLPSHVITPDHTYCQQSSMRHATNPSFNSSLSSDHRTSMTTPTYTELLRLPIGGYQLDQRQPYGGVRSMCVPSSDPVMCCTQVDHFCDLDMVPLVHDELLAPGDARNRLDLPFPPLPTSSPPPSLSPPKRTSVNSRSLLWPSFGCGHTSPVTFPEFHDFTDPLTGLLANRRSQPVFPAGPQILTANTENS